MSLTKRRKHKAKKVRRLAQAPPSLKPEQLAQILEAGNSAELCEFAGVKCLHNPSGAVMSLETLIQHRLDGCRPWRVADNGRDLTRARSDDEDSDGSRH